MTGEERPIKQICSKVHKVMCNVAHLNKDGEVTYGSTNYQYLSEEKITQEIKERMKLFKLVAFPVQVIDLPDSENYHRIAVTYKLVDIESGEYILVQVMGCGKDSGDKKTYKAMTGAFKYFQRQTFFISTGDDPDKDASGKINENIDKNGAKKYKKDPDKWDYTTEPVTKDYWDNKGSNPNIGAYKGDDGKWYFKRKKITVDDIPF